MLFLPCTRNEGYLLHLTSKYLLRSAGFKLCEDFCPMRYLYSFSALVVMEPAPQQYCRPTLTSPGQIAWLYYFPMYNAHINMKNPTLTYLWISFKKRRSRSMWRFLCHSDIYTQLVSRHLLWWNPHRSSTVGLHTLVVLLLCSGSDDNPVHGNAIMLSYDLKLNIRDVDG